jgi:cytochrome P450
VAIETTQPDDLYWDPFDFELQLDPHPLWRRMRDEAPLYRNEKYDFWALSRYQDVMDVVTDWKTFSSKRGDIIEVIMGGKNAYVESMLTEDPPIHDLHRKLVSRAFTPRAIQNIEDRVRQFAVQVLEQRVDSGGFDFVADFGAKVPGMVIAAMLGTPDSDLEMIGEMTDSMLAMSPDQAPEDRSHFDALAEKLGEYFWEKALERRKNPQDDMMSALVTMEFTDEHGVTRQLTDMEAVTYIHLLSVAGNETSARFSGWAGSVLAQYPDQRARLVAEPELVAGAFDEILRYESTGLAIARVTTRDVELHGQVVPEGAPIVLCMASTGRDERQYPDPDPNTLDVTRKVERQLAFGFGVHVCLGASLARMEGRIIMEEMLKRIPEWDVEWDKTEFVHAGSAVRGYSKLPIKF